MLGLFKGGFGRGGGRGLASPTIILVDDEISSNEPDSAVQSNVMFVNWARETAYLRNSDLPAEAMRSYYVDYYICQVQNGGHNQFAYNSGMTDVVLDNCEAGLLSLGDTEALQLFRDFVSMVRSSPDLLQRLTGPQWSEEKGLKALDRRFFARENYDTFSATHARWLLGLPVVEVLSRKRAEARKAKIIRSNKHFEERKAQADQREREARRASLRNYKYWEPPPPPEQPLAPWAAERLCSRRQIELIRIMPWPTPLPSGDGEVWTLRTSAGEMQMLLLPKVKAADLRQAGKPLMLIVFLDDDDGDDD